ncbi:MAG: ferritin [Candidatus Marinamargulisbacteria bacterium]|jgi:ferritin
MLSSAMAKLMTKQINNELFSAYSYLAMSAYFEDFGLKGSARWMRMQSDEELQHMRKQFDYVFDRGGQVALEAIGKPSSSWKSPLAVFESAYKQELAVTKDIHALVTLAKKENDYITENFLQWFISEQVEEEASIQGILRQLKLTGSNHAALFILDNQLGDKST